MEFPPQSNVENCAGDGLFRPQLNGFVLIGMWVWGRRWADHVPSHRGVTPRLARFPLLPLHCPRSLEQSHPVSNAAVGSPGRQDR
jgi:hypothetical protein